jgi:hypothetical protein
MRTGYGKGAGGHQTLGNQRPFHALLASLTALDLRSQELGRRRAFTSELFDPNLEDRRSCGREVLPDASLGPSRRPIEHPVHLAPHGQDDLTAHAVRRARDDLRAKA